MFRKKNQISIHNLSLAGLNGTGMTYASEFQNEKSKSKNTALLIAFFPLTNILQPALALVILTQTLNWNFFNVFTFSAWRIFTLAASLVPAFAIIGFTIMPESPKFLLSVGRRDEALKVLKTVYKMNNNNPKKVNLII